MQSDRDWWIGGSEIADIAGLNPFSHGGPSQVFGRKMGYLERNPDNRALMRGRHLGPALVSWLADDLGLEVTHTGKHEARCRSKEWPLVLAKPDGFLRNTKRSNPIAVAEVKTPGPGTMHHWGEPGTDEVPEYVLPQNQWEIVAARDIYPKIDRCVTAALIGGDLQKFEIGHNQELFEALYEIAERFVRDHLMTGKEPPVDGSKAARDLLLHRYPKATRDLIEATEDHEEKLRSYLYAKKLVKDKEREVSRIGQELMATIGDHDGIQGACANAYWRERKAAPSWKAIAESAMSKADLSDEDRKTLIAEHTADPYRHFQVYERKSKKGAK